MAVHSVHLSDMWYRIGEKIMQQDLTDKFSCIRGA